MKTVVFSLCVLVLLVLLSNCDDTIEVGNWESRTDLITARFMPSASVFDGKIYVFGGASSINGPVLNSVEVYDPESDSWSKCSDMPTARTHLATSIVDNKIYAIGGAGDPPKWPALSVLEVYDPIEDVWKIEKDLPVPRMGCHSCVVNNRIYVFGGLDDERQGVNRVDVYDPKIKTWTQLTDMPTARGELSSVEVNNHIYVIGGIAAVGKRSLGIVEVYNSVTDDWSGYTQLPTGRSHLGSVAYKDWIFTIGGLVRQVDDSVDAYPVATVEILNTSTKEWITSTPLPFPNALLTTSIVDGTIYAIGGYNDTVPGWPGIKNVEALTVK